MQKASLFCSLLTIAFLAPAAADAGGSGPSGHLHAPLLLVANQGDRDVSIIDTVTMKEIAKVPEGAVTGHEVAVSPDGRTAFVPIYGNSGVGKPGTNGETMVVIDIPSRKVIATVNFGHPVRPHLPVYDRHTGMLYVTTELDHAITIVNPRTHEIVGSIPTEQPESHMLVLSHNGKLGYTANVGPGTVSVLDMVKHKTIAVIPISRTTQRISISRDDSMVFTSDQTKPQLAVIDTSTNKIKAWVPLPDLGYGTASTKDGRWLLVTMPHAHQVAVVDLHSLKVVKTIDVPKSPTEIVIHPNGRIAYVSCGASGEIAVIDLSQWKVQSTIAAGKGADGMALAE